MKTKMLLLLTLTIASFLFHSGVSAKVPEPFAGIAIPLSDAGDNWNNGFALGVRFPLENTRHGNWSVITSFQQFNPNVEGMLETGGMEFKMEQSEGTSRHFELSLVGDRNIVKLTKWNLGLRLEYGAGIFLVSDAEVHVKGCYHTSTTKLTREIYRKADVVAAPGITVGGTVNMAFGANVVIHYQHLFTADPSRGLFLIGLGFSPF